jgi:XRE family transcriptional regulator, regulator of sulfur utilization
MSVGKSIKLFRVHANMKQKELAHKLEINESYLSLLESEKKEPSLSLLRKIAGALDVPIAMFFWENNEQNSENPLERLKSIIMQLDKEIKPHREKCQSN